MTMAAGLHLQVFRLVDESIINYSYLLFNEKGKGLIIDPSWQSEIIVDFIKNHDIDLELVLVTHSHSDHTHSIPVLKNLFPNLIIYMHDNEMNIEGFGFPDVMTFDSDFILNFHSEEIECIHTPGHTPGSVSYRIADHLFTGDFLFIEGCGMCDTIDDAVLQFKSIQKIKEKIPATTIIFPGHKFGEEPGKPLSYLREKNIYFHLDEKSFVNFRMRRNQTGLLAFK